MTPPWTITAPTRAAQSQASHPRLSIWVRANAGSGKTYVLAQRVVRLLLAGVEPSKILCLTFTKAAAANMSSRIFAILSDWTALPDAQLRKAIASTGADGDISLKVARRLFARAVETPGGLKIQTIHAFCERLLHLFPFEANVAASFQAIEGERQSALLEEAKDRVLRQALVNPGSPVARALAALSGDVSLHAYNKLVREALAQRGVISRSGVEDDNKYARALCELLDLDFGTTAEDLELEMLTGGIDRTRWESILGFLLKGKKTDQTVASKYQAVMNAATPSSAVTHYLDIFLTSKEEKRKGPLVTNSVPESINEELSLERERVCGLLDKLKAARLAEYSKNMFRLADAVIGEYTRLKNALGVLDFDDLIERARILLSRSDAAWVLYKLDAGIDHILVDEAQDTSPEQWEIINALASDFFSGASARAVHRTFFAVGDDKQSIYSFQGAAPEEFDRNAKAYAKKISEEEFFDIQLKMSFRSVSAILNAVDAVFSTPANFKGLNSGDPVKTVHEAWKDNLPGLVEIWPPDAPRAAPEPEDWRMPLDAVDEQAPTSVLARRIAERIKAMFAQGSGEAVHDSAGNARPVRAGDIMILVRRRNAFFEAIIRALKIAGVPVAGADRLKLVDHIAVMDLIAAGRAALLPEDDFTLACVLKSPLFNFDDDDLLRLAPARKGTLFAELQRSSEMRDIEAADTIAKWSRLARAQGPFSFYARLLGPDGGRRAILSRIGIDAGDAIDEFLQLALDWERNEDVSLTSFLHRMQSADTEIKRDMENAGDAVRVMTVHAAKGLEAKIVFLPDTCSAPSGHHDPALIKATIPHIGSFPVWRRNKSEDPAAIRQLIEDQRAQQQNEYHRLLYVAMTRAEERLYVCGYLGKTKMPDTCWHKMISDALAPRAEAAPAWWGEGEVLRFGDAARYGSQSTAAAPGVSMALPDWLTAPAPREAPLAPPLRPSQGLAAADQLPDAETGLSPVAAANPLALLEGELSHALLQHLPALPAGEREASALRYLAVRGQEISQARREGMTADVLAVIDHPKLRPVFGKQARAEVAIAGRVNLKNGASREIAGRIDRIAETDDSVLIADFKSGLPPKSRIPQRYIEQMALYRAALAPLFPGKTVRALLIWTSGPRIDEIPAVALDAALQEL